MRFLRFFKAFELIDQQDGRRDGGDGVGYRNTVPNSVDAEESRQDNQAGQ